MRRSVSKPRVARYHHTHRAPCSLRIRLSDNDKETTKGRIRPNFERRNRSRPANQASTPRAHPFHHAQNTETRYVSGIHTKKDTGSPRHVRGRPPFLESVSQKGNPQACRSLRVLKSVQRKQNAGEQKRPKTGWSPLCKWAAPEGPPKKHWRSIHANAADIMPEAPHAGLVHGADQETHAAAPREVLGFRRVSYWLRL